MKLSSKLSPFLFLSFFSVAAAAAADETGRSADRTALLAFKSLITADPSAALASWNATTSLPLCRWPGVSCSRDRRVSALSLDSLGLAGALSASLSALSSLRLLSLSNNSLSGPIPTELGALPRLTKLRLYTNNLSGSIPPSLGNLSSLTGLDLSENALDGGLPETLGRLTNLQFLQLSINQLSGELPSSLCNFSSVFYFDVGDNNLSGTLPFGIGSNLPSIKKLYFYSNRFEGSIPVSLSNASSLERLSLHENGFVGAVPPELGAIRGLSWLGLGSNRLHAGDRWEFLDALTNCSDLQVLELSDNLFDGFLPGSFANLSMNLEWLSMEDNQISGRIPLEIGRYINLTFFSIYNNLLIGSVPVTLGRLKSLNVLRLNGNRLSGEIPASLGNLTQLTELNLGGNRFYGAIPSSLGELRSLNLLNLSCNALNGSVPREVLSLSSLSQYLDMSHNSLTGILPLEIGSLRNLNGFNLSDNELIGEIPSSIGECQTLGYLRIEGNSLQGTIPSSLSSVKGIQELDLSCNNLSGEIPEFLQSFQFLQYLNLSFNDFEGKVPNEGVFRNSSTFSAVGNSRLCGDDPGLHLQACSIQPSKRHKSHRREVIIIIISVVLFIGIVLLSSFACWFLGLNLRKRSLVLTSDNYDHSRVSYSELLKATNGFSARNLIGVGSFGSVYKGIMNHDEKFVAVKVLNLQQRGALRSFVAECEVLKNTRHRNLVKILTSCASFDSSGNDFKALVLEFMPNGSLEAWLHPETRPESQPRKLSFISRLNIAVDVAYALDYLHHHGQIPIVHCDLKPSNVLLDDDMVAHVSDFGLAKFLPAIAYTSSEDPVSSVGIRGSIGYVAPEYGIGGQVSADGDVYSYGILLLEMFTGKRPTDDKFVDGLSLHKYAEMAFPEHVVDIIDRDLIDDSAICKDSKDTRDIYNSTERTVECLVSVIGIAISCSKESPRERTNMRDVVDKMVAAKNKFTGESL